MFTLRYQTDLTEFKITMFDCIQKIIKHMKTRVDLVSKKGQKTGSLSPVIDP